MGYSKIFNSFPLSIQNALGVIVEVSKPQKIVLFGSRARGTHRPASDFDFCLYGRSCGEADWARLQVDLEYENVTLYKIDLLDFEKLTGEYVDQIKKEGILVYDSNQEL